ncbi:MAG: NfeD family protein [Candidatus Babeliaceae bacterium]
MEMMVYLWLALATLCLLGELGHPGLFFFLACSGGALSAASLGFFGYPSMFQFLIFLVVSLIFLRGLKYIAFTTKSHAITNVQALIGKKAIIVVPLETMKPGQVKIQGELWSARSHDGQALPTNTVVEVLAIKGCHVIVKKINQEGNLSC